MAGKSRQPARIQQEVQQHIVAVSIVEANEGGNSAEHEGAIGRRLAICMRQWQGSEGGGPNLQE